ncbi:MAG: PTPA-CTERM sorting domain-containing protein [Leptolyngbya sp. SIO3F4]|nr:PTPA-CTERM sorting domain-containing protein [Leptolyngbya sp. SIO3F4]
MADPTQLKIGALSLSGVLNMSGSTNNATYNAVTSYITGFQFLGKDAVLNINAGTGVIAGFIGGSNFTIDALVTGDIMDLNGNLLGTAEGSFSSVKTINQVGNYSINLDGTAIPTPALLPGLVGLATAAFRKRKSELAE